MAIYCPMYDPMHGWYILVCGPNGNHKKPIVSPLVYYNSLGVKPPVGSKFTEQDYADFEFDMMEASAMTSLGPSMGMLAIPVSTSSQAGASAVPEFEDLTGLSNPLVFTPASAQSPFYNPATLSSASYPKISALMKSSVSDLVSLTQYVNSLHTLPNKFGSSLPLPSSPVSSGSFVYPPVTSGVKITSYSPLTLSPSMSHLPPLQFSSGTKHPLCSIPFSPQSSMFSGSKYKYNKSKPSSPMTYHPSMSMSSGSKYNFNSLHPSSSAISFDSSLSAPSSTKKFKYNKLPSASTSSSKSAYYMHSLPSTSSGTSKVKQPPIGTPNPLVPSAPPNPPKVNKSTMSSALFDDPNMAYEMYMDGVEESELNEDDYDMSEF